MPSKSKKQHNLMEAVIHNKEFADKVGIPQDVAQDFIKADEKLSREKTKEKTSKKKKK